MFAADTVVRIDTVTRPVFELVGPEALGEFIGAAVQRFAFFEFVRLNSHVELAGRRRRPTWPRARLFMCEVRRDVGTLDWSVAYGLYHDRYRRRRRRVAVRPTGLPVAHPDRWRRVPLPARMGPIGPEDPPAALDTVDADRTREAPDEPVQRGPTDPGGRGHPRR